VGDQGEPVGWNVADFYLKIVARLGRLRLGRGRRSGMGEGAVFLDEFARLAKSGYGFLFVSSRIDRKGDDLVETLSAQVRNIPENDRCGAVPPKLADLIRSL